MDKISVMICDDSALMRNLIGRIISDYDGFEIAGKAENGRDLLDKLPAAKPDVIINTLNGDSNIAFFAQLRAADISAEDLPVMSFSIGESEIKNIGAQSCKGNYVAWTYFESLTSNKNHKFVEDYKKHYGQEQKD